MDVQLQPQWASHPLAGPKVLYRPSTMDPKQRFYHHFQESEADLQDQINNLESVAQANGERQTAIDHILAGISKLQNETADAAEYTPAYDRKLYAESIKTLQENLNATVTRITPKSRFQFKRTAKKPTAHVDMGAAENDPRLHPGSLARNRDTAAAALTSPVAAAEATAVEEAAPGKDYNEEMAKSDDPGIRKPSFSQARSISISKQSGLHIILPPSAARATSAGSLTNLKSCIVDMSAPTGAVSGGTPFPGLALKNISRSLIVAGRVSGPVHITGLTDSILVVTARQARIHECKNVDIYLHCGSHPIIEDCSGMRFSPLPACYARATEEMGENQWDQVDDFKWLKAGHSPNWTILSEAERLTDDVWTKTVPGQPGVSVEETLAKVGLSP